MTDVAAPPITPQAGLDAFLSYSRVDREFVTRLRDVLEADGHNVWIDADDIPPGAPWRRELGTGIEAADAFVFVISPESVVSVECGKELARAIELGKRLIPVLVRPAENVPDEIAALQWVDGSGSLDETARAVGIAIETDHDWTKEHTRWLARALAWDAESRDRGSLLRGLELRTAEQWLLDGSTGKQPPPTHLHNDFIGSSRRAAQRRLRTLVVVSAVGALVATTLAIVAMAQRNTAVTQSQLATSRELAATAISQIEVDPERSLLLALHAIGLRTTPESIDALRRSLTASHVRMVVTVDEGVDTAVVLVDDGARAITAGGDSTPQIWDVATGDATSAFIGHDGRVCCVDVSEASGLVATASEDGTARVWDLTTGEAGPVLEGHDGPVSSVDLDSAGRLLVTGGADGTVRVWDVGTGEQLDILQSHSGEVSASFGPGATTVITAGFADGAVLVWDLDRGSIEQLGEGGHPMFSAVFLASGGDRAVTVSSATTAIWDVQTGQVIADLGTQFSAASSSDGAHLVTGDRAGIVRLWTSTGELMASFPVMGGPILSVAFSGDGTLFASAGLDGSARIWEVATGMPVATLRGHGAAVSGLALTDNGRLGVTTGGDGTVRAWTIPAALVLDHSFAFGGQPAPAPVVAAAFTPRGDRLISVAATTGVYLWGATSAQDEGGTEECPEYPGAPSCLAGAALLGHAMPLTGGDLSPDGRLLVSTGMDGTARIWDVASAQSTAILAGHEGAVWSARYSSDGDRIVTLGADGSARIWETATGEVVAVLATDGSVMTSAAFSPDSSQVATGDDSGAVRLWDAATGSEVGTVAALPEGVLAVAFDPDGASLAVATGPNIRVIDAATSAVTLTLRGHNGLVTSLEYSADGRLILSGGHDGTARVWDANSGQAVFVLAGHEGAVNDASFDRTATRIATASDDGTVRVVRCEVCAPFDQLVAQAEAGLTRQLTETERIEFLHEG